MVLQQRLELGKGGRKLSWNQIPFIRRLYGIGIDLEKSLMMSLKEFTRYQIHIYNKESIELWLVLNERATVKMGFWKQYENKEIQPFNTQVSLAEVRRKGRDKC